MRKLDNFISVKPCHQLQKYIDSYYFHSSDDPCGDIKFTYYPHIKHAVTIYDGSVAETQGNLTIVNPHKTKNSVLYSTVRERPQNVEIKGAFKKIGIVFKPYGINRFVHKNLKEFNNDVISCFEEWHPEVLDISQEIWNTEEIAGKVSILETFIKNQETKNVDEHFSNFIEEISESKNIETVQEITGKYYANRKALYRVFKRELNCTPSSFFKILRFRKSLERYLKTNEINLTEVAMAQFYDQSDFIKNVKQVTDTTPKKLSKQLSDLENAIFWKIS